ncbi:hypothetical protein OSH05_01265 [Kaistia algarum]|nr:hypothetical protein [Kaistia algarum]
MSLSSFSIADRQREKNESRLRDEARLAEGDAAAREVGEENGLFSAFDPSRARVVARRIRFQAV